MAKKDNKIEIKLVDAKVTDNATSVDGSQLVIGKRIVGNIAELDGKFAVIKNEQVASFYKSLDQAIESIIEDYNLNH
ncbi:DUF2969 domain-containing protein [Streptococcus suis]